MRLSLAVFFLTAFSSVALAQTQSGEEQPTDSDQSTGRTVLPAENKGQLQPQGWTGPVNTAPGDDAPAESPQGDSPPGMQAAPEGSSKTIVEPNKSEDAN